MCPGLIAFIEMIKCESKLWISAITVIIVVFCTVFVNPLRCVFNPEVLVQLLNMLQFMLHGTEAKIIKSSLIHYV